jgi:hypothetical protein
MHRREHQGRSVEKRRIFANLETVKRCRIRPTIPFHNPPGKFLSAGQKLALADFGRLIDCVWYK